MAIKKITTTEFLQLAETHPVLDVRSPLEYAQAHIPGAHNISLFTDEEKKIVGTAYKQQSRETAIKIGLDFFDVKMRSIVEDAERIVSSGQLTVNKKNTANRQPTENCILLHCWRGGMRSAGMAWVLDLYGFKVYTLAGGYKAYRNWVLEQFDKEYKFKIIGGYTGSGKTLLLHALKKEGNAIIDLERLANHKGSALGGIGQEPQAGQEMFENLLATKLAPCNQRSSTNDPRITINDQPPTANYIYLEDESQRIGNLQIPMPLWNTMRKSPVLFLDIPFEERLDYLTEEYSIHPKEKLVNAVIRIQKRLGGLETKNTINFLLEDDHKEAFRILLKYYDKWYAKGLYNRENADKLIHKIPALKVDTDTNIKLIKQQSLHGV